VTSRALSFLLLALQAPEPGVLGDVQRSNIEANVPPAAEFAALLKRDLEAYFKAAQSQAARVEHDLLRDGPTQSGVSYPKFYVWVRVFDGAALVNQGAVRLAAIDRKRFDVTTFMSAEAIREDPAGLYKVFPAPVCEKIRAKMDTRR